MSATGCRVCGTNAPIGHDCRDEFQALRAQLADSEARAERLSRDMDKWSTLYGRAFMTARGLMDQGAYDLFVQLMDKHRSAILAPEPTAGHVKSWECVKPGGDGCDGNHRPGPADATGAKEGE